METNTPRSPDNYAHILAQAINRGYLDFVEARRRMDNYQEWFQDFDPPNQIVFEDEPDGAA